MTILLQLGVSQFNREAAGLGKRETIFVGSLSRVSAFSRAFYSRYRRAPATQVNRFYFKLIYFFCYYNGPKEF